MNEKEALNHAMKLCTRKEYASGEIMNKLMEWELTTETAQVVLSELITEKFIDDKRYCQAFINDKLKFSKWGKTKMTYMLKQKGITEDIISEGISNIPQELYEDILQVELTKKLKTLKVNDKYVLKGKLIQFAVTRGFEYSVANKLAEKILQDTL